MSKKTKNFTGRLLVAIAFLLVVMGVMGVGSLKIQGAEALYVCSRWLLWVTYFFCLFYDETMQPLTGRYGS